MVSRHRRRRKQPALVVPSMLRAVCRPCGKPGPHFAPPPFGEPGPYVDHADDVGDFTATMERRIYEAATVPPDLISVAPTRRNVVEVSRENAKGLPPGGKLVEINGITYWVADPPIVTPPIKDPHA